jgi:exosortase family protein XrtM
VADATTARGLSYARIAAFVATFATLQLLWQGVRELPFGSWVVRHLVLDPAAIIVKWLTPKLHVVVGDDELMASGVGLRLQNGCEGVETLLLLTAALLAWPATPGQKLRGVVAGALFVFLLNQARLVTLFYSFRADPSLFDRLHSLVMPVVVVLAVVGYATLWQNTLRRANA